MKHSKKQIGEIGESLAVKFLKQKGYRIIEQNYRSTWGEIDIVAQDEDILTFVEVKTRRSLKFGTPQLAVTNSKQRKISKAALEYLQENVLFDSVCRFDVISIVFPPEPSEPIIEHIENAFELSEEYAY
ncbi:TPA: YraN family protein [Candidatus Poribacteria bacterium]|nr:YraN family protein [Candidatus Poribacteria bacterium]